MTKFALARTPNGGRTLRERKVLVRHFDTPRIADGLRITVGVRRDNDTLLSLLGELLGK